MPSEKSHSILSQTVTTLLHEIFATSYFREFRDFQEKKIA